MRETILRDFFLGRVSTEALTNDVVGSAKQVGPISYSIQIEDMEETFALTRAMLVSLCDAVLSRRFPPQELSTIGFALEASDKFTWDGEDVIGRIIDDWACPEINYPLTLENIQTCKNWLLELEPSLPEPQQGPLSKGESHLNVVRKKRRLSK